MLQVASQDRAGMAWLRLLAEEPGALECGLKVLDVGLRLAPELALDLVLKDKASRPLVVLGEEYGGVMALSAVPSVLSARCVGTVHCWSDCSGRTGCRSRGILAWSCSCGAFRTRCSRCASS